MKIKNLSIALICASLILLSGCRTSPVYNVSNNSVITSKSQHTEDDVKMAILRAGSSLGWSMNAEKPGNMVGTLHLRAHMAQVNIKYDSNKYSITYKNSENLNYNATRSESGTASIHSNYNGWIQNLDRAIKSQLSAL